jgi:hypothetical protein
MVKLAAHLCGFSIFQIHPSAMAQSHEYKIGHFKNDLVQAYNKAGVKVRIKNIWFLQWTTILHSCH